MMLSTRAGLSFSMAAFGIFALAGHSLWDWKKSSWWWIGALWVAGYGASYFWSEDKDQWGRSIGVKMPIVLLPLAFALLPTLDVKHLRAFVCGVLGLLLAGVLYSIAYFIVDPRAVIEGYSFSHTLRTPLYNSHIHFSAAIAAGIVFGVAAFRMFERRWQKVMLIAALLAFAAYLHLLASKTGLVMLYLFVGLLVVRTAVRGRLLVSVSILFLCIACAWAALRFIPTLQSRANYVAYTWQQVMEGRRDGLYSDLGRALSWEVGGRLAARHPVAGVGAGDLLHAMRGQYAETYPGVASENQLIPHNQLLCVWLAAGTPTLVIFLIWLLAPLRWMRQHPRRFYLRAMWAMLLMPLLVEPFLEVQAGVAVYLYFLLSGQYLLRCMTSVPGTSRRTALSGDLR